MVDTDLKKIGNPIPDYLISLRPYLSFKQRLKLSFIVDFKQGGEVWEWNPCRVGLFGSEANTQPYSETRPTMSLMALR